MAEWGFTIVEVEELGLVALNEFQLLFGVNLLDCNMTTIKSIYEDLINKPNKYVEFAIWLKDRLDKFIELKLPMRIYVGGEKQFISRGDDKLENSLLSVSHILTDYIVNGYITPKRISNIFYYVNLMFK